MSVGNIDISLNNYGVQVPSIEAINEGYNYSGTTNDGAVIASPDSFTVNNFRHFYDTNVADVAKVSESAEFLNYMNDEYYSVLNSVGVTSDPSKGDNFRPIGVDYSGKRLFSSQSMITSADYQLGAKSIKNTSGVLNGFSVALDKPVLDQQEEAKLKTISDNSQDPAVMQQLNALKQDKNSEGFIEKVFDFFTDGIASVTNTGVSQGKTKKQEPNALIDGLSTAYQAYAMYEMWDFLSPAQKALGLANVGIKSYNVATGEKLGKKILVDATYKADGSELTPALKVEDALQMFSAGVNAYSLAKNWDQLSDISRLVGGARTLADIAKTAKNLNLLGSGINGAATTANAGQLAQAGYKSVPHLGVGALVGPASASVPQGYTVVSYTDDSLTSVAGGRNAIIVPDGNAETAAGVSSNSGSVLNTAVGYGTAGLSAYGAYQSFQEGDYLGGGLQAVQAYSAFKAVGTAAAAKGAVGGAAASGGTAAATGGTTAAGAGGGLTGAQIAGGVAGIAAGAYTIYQGWGTGGKEGVINGAIGGASMAAGMYALGATNPFLLAGVVIVAALSGLIKTGKHGDQVERDAVRARFKEVGFVDDNWSITLADGTKADIGIDGNGGLHNVKDTAKMDSIVAKGRRTDGKLHSYEVDFTNDIEFFSSMGGVSLSRLIAGGAAKNVDQMGGQLGNAFLKNIDTADGQLTEEKFKKMTANQRSVYAQAGIKTKADAYALANQMYAESRITDSELLQMHQTFNMMWDENGFELATRLNSTRWHGVEVAAEKREVEDPRKIGLGKQRR